MKRICRPMNRGDWAWLLACLICAFLVAVLFAVPEIIWEREPHYGTEYSSLAVNGKIVSESTKSYQYVVPVYTRKIIIRTNGDTKDIFEAVNGLQRQDIDMRMESIPAQHFLSWSDFFGGFFGFFFLLMMGTAVIRIVEKGCRRLLGVSDENGIIRDPSTSSG
jgi:hypothetical protein